MSSQGKKLRLNKIFGGDGKVLIVPVDHGLASGAVMGLEYPGKTIKDMIEGGADAILATYGIIKKYYQEFGGKGVIVRFDGGPTDWGEDIEATDLMYTVEDAIRIGADAIITSTWLGGPHEARTMTSAAKLAAACEAWGMPLIIETFMSSQVQPTVENVKMAARIACDLGADVVKTYLVGDESSYREVTSKCFCPIVILGGEKNNDELMIFKWVKTAVDAGAVGSCIGRNVFQHKNPKGVVQGLKSIIHGNAAVEDVANLIS